MPFVSIKFVKENIAADPDGKMSRIADRVSQAISDEMGVARDDVWIAFEAIAATDFHVGADSVAVRRARKK
jgi:4-oxalocrotonate tautomerase